jgi:hypothetical protein
MFPFIHGNLPSLIQIKWHTNVFVSFLNCLHDVTSFGMGDLIAAISG